MASRKIAIAVDSAPESERALDWAQEHLFKARDEIHLIHVVQHIAPQPVHEGAPPVDFMPTAQPVAREAIVAEARQFLQERFVQRLEGMQPPPVVHIVESDGHANAIGSSICRTAEQLDAVAIVMASRKHTKMQEFFLGSVTNFCTHHSRQPILVVH